jgi:hypothetical protein
MYMYVHVEWFICYCVCVLLCSAQKEGLLCEEEDPRDPRNVVYCGYCSTHYKKMVSYAGNIILKIS